MTEEKEFVQLLDAVETFLEEMKSSEHDVSFYLQERMSRVGKNLQKHAKAVQREKNKNDFQRSYTVLKSKKKRNGSAKDEVTAEHVEPDAKVLFRRCHHVASRYRRGSPPWAAAILGVSPQADYEQLQASYKKRAQIWHPDAGFRNPEAMVMLNEAFRILKARC